MVEEPILASRVIVWGGRNDHVCTSILGIFGKSQDILETRIGDTGEHRDSTIRLIDDRFDNLLPFFPVKERKLSARPQREQPVDSSINQEIHESSSSLRVDLLVVSYCCGHWCYDPFQLFHSQSVNLSLETCFKTTRKVDFGEVLSLLEWVLPLPSTVLRLHLVILSACISSEFSCQQIVSMRCLETR